MDLGEKRQIEGVLLDCFLRRKKKLFSNLKQITQSYLI